MTAKELSKILDGREYGKETTRETINKAKENGLVIVYAHSDHVSIFEGSINEAIECSGGKKMFFNKDGSNFTDENGITDNSRHKTKDKHEANCIEAVWCEKEKVWLNGSYFSWTFKTDIPHETFDIFE